MIKKTNKWGRYVIDKSLFWHLLWNKQTIKLFVLFYYLYFGQILYFKQKVLDYPLSFQLRTILQLQLRYKTNPSIYLNQSLPQLLQLLTTSIIINLFSFNFNKKLFFIILLHPINPNNLNKRPSILIQFILTTSSFLLIDNRHKHRCSFSSADLLFDYIEFDKSKQICTVILFLVEDCLEVGSGVLVYNRFVFCA